jgi:hypothetical protein
MRAPEFLTRNSICFLSGRLSAIPVVKGQQFLSAKALAFVGYNNCFLPAIWRQFQ